MLTTEKKEEIKRRIALELEHSNLTQAKAATLLGMSPVYFSKIKDKFQWKNIPESVWGRWNNWEATGDTFENYADDYGTATNQIKEKTGPKPTNGEVKKHFKASEIKPTNGEMKSEDNLKVIAERIECLKGQGFIVEFSLTLPA